jgi:hypothetical protein
MMFVCRFEPKEKKENEKRSNCNIRTSRKRRKIDIAHQNFIFIAQIRITSFNTLLIFIFT